MSDKRTAENQSRLLLPFTLLVLCVLALLVTLFGLYRTSSIAGGRVAELTAAWQNLMQDGVQGSELLLTDRLVQSAALPFPAVESAALWSLGMAVLSVVILAWFVWVSRTHQMAQSAKIRQSEDHDVAATASLLDEIAPLLSGDLDVRATAREGKAGVLADTINFLVSELKHLVASQLHASRTLSSIVEESQAIMVGMESLNKTQSEQLVQSSNTISGNSQSTAALSASALEAESSSSNIEASLNQLMKNMSLGRQQMDAVRADSDNAIELVQSVNDHARSALQAVTRVDEFVEHTEHMAINATLQSSADDASGGPSLARLTTLANEVSILAEEFSRSVEDINVLLHAVHTDTANAMNCLHRVAKSVSMQIAESDKQSPLLSAVNAQSRVVKSNVSQIAEYGASHNREFNTISKSLDGVNQTGHDHSRAMNEASETLDKLKILAAQLRQDTSEFKLPQRDSRLTHNPVKSVARKAAERAAIDG